MPVRPVRIGIDQRWQTRHLQHLDSARSRSICAFVLVLLMAGVASAQGTRVYRDGRSWVEESSGTMPASRVLRVNTPLGSVRVEGGGNSLRWTVRKRFFAGSEEEAKRQFAAFRVNASRSGDGAVLEVNDESHTRGRFDADFELHIPATMEAVRIESGNGDIAVTGRGLTARSEYPGWRCGRG